MPVFHGLTSGIEGGLHTENYHIINHDDAYLIPIKLLCFTLIDLLCNGAKEVEKVISEFKPVMTKEEYLNYLKEVEQTYILE